MTSKKDLRSVVSNLSNNNVDLHKKVSELANQNYKLECEVDAYKRENEVLAPSYEHSQEHVEAFVQFIEDLYVIEPQLQHTLTNGAWDFERVHRAAEALRNEDALASVGYTDQCIDWPDNVTPLFPRGPEGAAA